MNLLLLCNLVVTNLASPKCRAEDNIKTDFKQIYVAITKFILPDKCVGWILFSGK
jgi:hypothetical protein